MKKRDVLSYLLAMIWSLSSVCAATTAATSETVVMTVDGEPVTAPEYRLVMEGKTGEVFNYFFGKDGREDRPGYWQDDGQAENPIRRLRTVVTEELRRIKAVQRIAKEKGVLTDISFAAFQAELGRENERRRKAVEKNEVIYGPKQYQPYRYYFFRLQDHEQAAFEAFIKDPANAAPDKAIADFYAANASHFEGRALSETRDQIARIIQRKAFDAMIVARVEKAKVEIDAEALNAIAPRHDS